MHKHAHELVSGDKFQMALSIFQVIDAYDVDNEDLVKIAFESVDFTHSRPTNFLIVDRDLIFHLW